MRAQDLLNQLDDHSFVDTLLSPECAKLFSANDLRLLIEKKFGGELGEAFVNFYMTKEIQSEHKKSLMEFLEDRTDLVSMSCLKVLKEIDEDEES